MNRVETIRFLELEDMPAAAELEAQCFPSFWTAQQFADTWQQDWFAAYGLFLQNRLTAYITLSVLAGELEVLNIAVQADCRGRGLSHRLMAFALQDTLRGGHLRARGRLAEFCTMDEPALWTQGVLEVRVGNAPARALYTAMGFTAAGCRRHYYSDGEDALVMTLTAEGFCKKQAIAAKL